MSETEKKLEHGADSKVEAHGAAPDAHSAVKKKKEGTGLIGWFFRVPWKDSKLLVTGLFSPDVPTRKMTVFFLLSVMGCLSVGGYACLQARATQKMKSVAAAQAAEEIQKALESKHAVQDELKESTVSLGHFTLELKPVPERRSHGLVNMAETEIVVICDGKETAEYLERNKTVARSTLLSVLTVMDREELLTKEGKKRWKSVLLKQLNAWLGPSRILDLYFSRLVIN